MREKSEKGTKTQRVKPPTPNRAIDALIGGEEQNGKQRKEQKERNRELDSTQLIFNILKYTF